MAAEAEERVEMRAEEETVKESSKRSSEEVSIGDESDSTTLYIKNLNWSSSEEAVRRLFGQVEGLKAVTLPKKKGPDGELLPMGFGFVVYETRQQALKALNRFNGKALDGHVLQLKFSARKDVVTTKKRRVTEEGEGAGRTKLMVRNIPFEATRTELLRAVRFVWPVEVAASSRRSSMERRVVSCLWSTFRVTTRRRR